MMLHAMIVDSPATVWSSEGPRGEAMREMLVKAQPGPLINILIALGDSMRLEATHDNVVLRHIDSAENKTKAGLVLPKGAKGVKNQVNAFLVTSTGCDVREICVGHVVLAPDALSVMHTPGQRGTTQVLVPDMIDDEGNSFVVVQETACRSLVCDME